MCKLAMNGILSDLTKCLAMYSKQRFSKINYLKISIYVHMYTRIFKNWKLKKNCVGNDHHYKK